MNNYTYFTKLPDQPYEFDEGDKLDEFIARAEAYAKEHSEAVITICNRQTDHMVWQQNEFGPKPGPCNVCLTGMFD